MQRLSEGKKDNDLELCEPSDQIAYSWNYHPRHRRLFLVNMSLESSARLRDARTRHITSASAPDLGARDSRKYLSLIAGDLRKRLCAALTDRRFGGIVLQWHLDDLDDIAFAAFLIARSIGDILPETRRTYGGDMTPENYVRITLHSVTEPVGRRRHFGDPAMPWPLHTDRALHEDVGDFLLVAKTVEHNAVGGLIRLLHLDDFSRRDEFTQSALAQFPLEWRGDVLLAPLHERPRLQRQKGVMAPVFERTVDGWNVRFTDSRFRHPMSAEHGSFLRELDAALATDGESISSFCLPIGGFYIVNNRFWLHGREGFQETAPGFQREVLRFCGNINC